MEKPNTESNARYLGCFVAAIAAIWLLCKFFELTCGKMLQQI